MYLSLSAPRNRKLLFERQWLIEALAIHAGRYEKSERKINAAEEKADVEGYSLGADPPLIYITLSLGSVII